MNKTKIDWCDSTVNPVVGCPNGCEWCYARRQNNRFHYVENWDQPEFKPEALKKLKVKKGRVVFIDSMSDIGRWAPEVRDTVLDAIMKNPQHMYVALTKCRIGPLMRWLYKTLREMNHPDDCNLYLGKSITTQAQMDQFIEMRDNCDFLSIEPLLEPIDLKDAVHMIGEVIIGAETGNRKGKVKPDAAWVREIVRQADAAGVRVFMKESLRSIMGADFRQDRLAWYRRLDARAEENETNQKGDKKQ